MNRREVLGSVGAISLLASLDAVATAPQVPAAAGIVLRIGSARAGTGNHRWAPVLDGEIADESLRGVVQAGRLDWHVDPASGAVEATLYCRVRQDDGRELELRRTGLGATRLDDGRVLLRAFSPTSSA